MDELFIRSMAYSIATTYKGQIANDACGRDAYDQIKVKATVPKIPADLQ